MANTFRTVFELSVLHNFYSDLRCRDFSLFPVSDTARLMRNHTMLFRNNENASRVLILADELNLTAARPVASGEGMVFAMKLNNPGFSCFTNEYPSGKKIFLFTNEGLAPGATELSRKEISLCGKMVSHRIVSNLAVTLILKDRKNQVIASAGFPAGSSGRDHCFEFILPRNDFYTVTEDITSVVYTYYNDSDLLFSGILGMVQIINQPASPYTYDGNTKYTISFTARSSPWSYYVVAPGMSGTDIGHLSIENVVGTGVTPVHFTKTYPIPPGDKIAPLLHGDTSKIALFVSNESLAFRQFQQKQMRLKKNGTVLINHMPNPDALKPGAEMFIYV